MKALITVLAYKCNGVETRRCCVVGRWSSDFDTLTTTNPDKAASWMAERMNAKDAVHWEGSYDLKVLINGADEDFFDDDEDEASYDFRQALRQQIEVEAHRKYTTHLSVVANAS